MAVRKRALALGIAGAVIALALSAAVIRWATAPEDHAARVMLYLSTDSSDDDADHSILDDADLTRCARAVDDPAIAARVIELLDLDVTPDELGDSVAVERRDETALLEVTVHDRSPRQAVLITDAYGLIAQQRLSWLEGDACSTDGHRVMITLTEPATLVED